MEDEFGKEIENLVKSTIAAMDSAFMSDDFLESADKSFNEIPNFMSKMSLAEDHVDSSDTA